MKNFGSAIWFVVCLALMLAYSLTVVRAYFDGMALWLGASFWVSLVAIIVLCFLRLTIVILPAAVYGLVYVWHWSWALSLAFVFPGVALSLGFLFLSFTIALLERLGLKRSQA